MSVARKCNKCGICFDPLNEEGRMARFENPIFQTSSDVKNNARGYLLVPELGVTGTIDLCPDCSDKFLEFFLVNKKKKDVIAEAIEPLTRPLDGDFDGDADIRDRIVVDPQRFQTALHIMETAGIDLKRRSETRMACEVNG